MIRKSIPALGLVALLAAANQASAELLYEGFNYTADDSLSTAPSGGESNPNGLQWAVAGASTTDNPTITSSGLTVTGLAPSSGNALTWGGTGNASRIPVGPFGTTAAGNTVFYSFALNVSDLSTLQPNSSATGGIIGGFNTVPGPQTGVPSVVGARLFAKQTADGLQYLIGFSKNSSTAGDIQYDTTPRDLNTTYLLVASYTLIGQTGATATDDTAKVWIAPDPSSFGTASAPAPTFTATSGPDLSTGRLETFVWRQSGVSTATGGMNADELRVGTTWGEVTPVPGTTWTGGSGTWSDATKWNAGSPNAAATFANFDDTTPGAKTITLDVPKTIGTAYFKGSGAVTIAGDATSTLTFSGGSSVNVYAGSHEIAAPVSLAQDLNVSVVSGSTMRLSGDMTSAAGTSLRKEGTGVLELKSAHVDDLKVDDGMVRMIPSGASAAGVSTVKSLSLPQRTIAAGSFATAAGRVDLTDNAIIVDYTGATSPLTTGGVDRPSLSSLLKLGYNNGSWDGPGISSSTAHADATGAHKTALGYAEQSQIGITSFKGQPMDADSVLIRYTYAGDANLDGKVDTLDFNALAGNFGGTSKVWSQADFNYDGVVDTLDFNFLASNFGQQLPQAGGGAGAGALVPEPASLTLIGAGVLAIASRRRRRAAQAR